MEADRVGDATLYTGDVLASLAEMEAESVHCVVTSPPYYALRDYGVPGQIGLEETPEAYIAKMVEVFRAVRRVLRDDGTLWLNIGDSYAGSGKGPSNSLQGDASCIGNRSIRWEGAQPENASGIGGRDIRNRDGVGQVSGMKPKDLMGIPWMLAFALRADGWYLRSDIIWAKPNPMPESVTDRPTKAHEYLFLLSKSVRYFYDAEAIKEMSIRAGETRVTTAKGFAGQATGLGVKPSGNAKVGSVVEIAAGRNRRTVWTIATEPYPEAHFATFPRKLVQTCILAGCPEHACPKCGAPWVKETTRDGKAPTFKPLAITEAGALPDGGVGTHRNLGGRYQKYLDENPVRTIGEHPTCACGLPPVGGVTLDPFGGSGTTAEVALEYGRRAILIELKPEYVELQKKRLEPVAGRPLLNFA